MGPYNEDPPPLTEPHQAREPLHQRVAVLEKRINELEGYLRRAEEFMGHVSRELGF